MDKGNPGPAGIELVGGALCLDFANTKEGREGPEARDFIRDPHDLIVWGRRVGALPASMVIVPGEAEPDEGALGRALALREAIYRVFTAIVRNGEPDEADLTTVQRTFAEGMRHARLIPGPNRPRPLYAWECDGSSVDILQWRVSESAVDLLRSGPLERLKQCPGGGDGPCNWLFIDTTRGGNRRWCSMSDCGARAKWRRQNARRRTQRC